MSYAGGRLVHRPRLVGELGRNALSDAIDREPRPAISQALDAAAARGGLPVGRGGQPTGSDAEPWSLPPGRPRIHSRRTFHSWIRHRKTGTRSREWALSNGPAGPPPSC